MVSRSVLLRFCLVFLFYSQTCIGALGLVVNDLGDAGSHDPSDPEEVYSAPEIVEQPEVSDLRNLDSAAVLSELNVGHRRSRNSPSDSEFFAPDGSMQNYGPELALKSLEIEDGYEDQAALAAYQRAEQQQQRNQLLSSYSRMLDDLDSLVPLGRRDDEEKRAPKFRLGRRADDDDGLEKRAPKFRLGKRELIAFEKRDPTFRLGKRNNIEEKRVPTFRLGKRENDGDVEKRGPTFRLGKRRVYEELEKRGPTFRLGKREYEVYGKRAPKFRLGKRLSYEDLEKRAPKFRLGKRENEEKRAPKFRLGKREEDEDDVDKRAPKFRLGKRSDEEEKRAPKFRLGKRESEWYRIGE